MSFRPDVTAFAARRFPRRLRSQSHTVPLLALALESFAESVVPLGR